jgi:hypothetical protein
MQYYNFKHVHDFGNIERDLLSPELISTAEVVLELLHQYHSRRISYFVFLV